jgi:hypothetical protein
MWYPYHAFAYLALLLLAVGVIGLTFVAVNLNDRDAIRAFFASLAPHFPVVAPFLAICVLSALILWVAMLRNHLRLAEPRSAWTAWLILGNWGAAIAYFFFVWRPSHARVGT